MKVEKFLEGFFFNSSEMKEYMNSTKFHVKLIGDSSVIKKEISENKFVLKMSIDYLVEMTLINEVMIICENIDDYDVYKRIAEYYLYTKKLSKLRVRLNEVSGSGSGISNSFTKKINQNKYFVIAIADTDKIAPKDEIGQTLQVLKEEYEKIKDYCLGDIFYSNYNEVENLIPLYVYEKELKLLNDEIENYIETAVSSNCNARKTNITFREFLLIMHKEKREDIANYFDFKKGLNRDRYNKPEVEEYWKKIIEVSGLKVEILNNSCIIDKYAKRPINKVINIFNNETIENIDSRIDNHKRELWYEIGEFLYSWGCAAIKPMRVV